MLPPTFFALSILTKSPIRSKSNDCQGHASLQLTTRLNTVSKSFHNILDGHFSINDWVEPPFLVDGHERSHPLPTNVEQPYHKSNQCHATTVHVPTWHPTALVMFQQAEQTIQLDVNNCNTWPLKNVWPCVSILVSDRTQNNFFFTQGCSTFGFVLQCRTPLRPFPTYQTH